ncbi:hypothetical protein ILYODFUR_015009 [Ilyodon furcidens]|uniref:Uncharacterized protein n=1 Tax=Ilyodon furcidens TaxID=33524 RepID=A0ABV0U7C6_9TELE
MPSLLGQTIRLLPIQFVSQSRTQRMINRKNFHSGALKRFFSKASSSEASFSAADVIKSRSQAVINTLTKGSKIGLSFRFLASSWTLQRVCIYIASIKLKLFYFCTDLTFIFITQ